MPPEIQKTPRQVNWTIIIVVGLLVLGAVGFSYTQAIKKENAFETQQKCAQAAKDNFNAHWSSVNTGVEGRTYEDHWNAAAGKCYILVKLLTTDTDHNIIDTEELDDAVEGKDYGEFIGITHGPSYGQSPGVCFMGLVGEGSNSATKCYSQAEWEKYRDGLMSN
jgi:hypothetical protein